MGGFTSMLMMLPTLMSFFKGADPIMNPRDRNAEILKAHQDSKTQK